MRVPFYQINAFARSLFHGNPAVVCEKENVTKKGSSLRLCVFAVKKREELRETDRYHHD